MSDLPLAKGKNALTVVVALGGLILAVAITASYLGAIIFALKTAGEPPLLADPATTMPVSGQSLPQQLRGAVNRHEEVMSIIAVISPLVTTIIAFYFGTRAGAATQSAETNQARLETTQNKVEVARVVGESNPRLMSELRQKKLA